MFFYRQNGFAVKQSKSIPLYVSLRGSWIKKLIVRWEPQYSFRQGSRIDRLEIYRPAPVGADANISSLWKKWYVIYIVRAQNSTAHESSSQVTRTKHRNIQNDSHMWELRHRADRWYLFQWLGCILMNSVTQTQMETVCETIEFSPMTAAFPNCTSAKLWVKLAYLTDLANTKIRECYSHSWNLLHASTKTNEGEDHVNHP